MSESKSYQRSPAINCWIYHLLEGKYSEEIRSLHTIFGEIKRIRIVATIVRKREIVMTQAGQEDEYLDDEFSNMRVEFDLDDGTGIIRAIIWRVNPEKYSDYKEGDIVDVIGLIRYWNGYVSVAPEIMKKVEEPDFILLQNAQIIKKITKGDLKEIPQDMGEDNLIDVIPDEIDLNELYEDDIDSSFDDVKSKIFRLIEEHKNGISYKDIKKSFNISEEDLKSYIRDLEMESRIYQSEENIFHTF